MTDAELLVDINTITDPMRMLELIVENDMIFGDPYYSDIRGALMYNAARIIQEHRFNHKEVKK